MGLIALGLGEDDRCQMRAEPVRLTLPKLENGGDRVVAIALRLGSRQQRAQGAIAGERKPVKLGHRLFPSSKWVLERVNFLACRDKLPFGHPSFYQANVRQEAFSVLFTLGAKPVP